MVPSKFVNFTSPFSSEASTGTAEGAVARISDRIMDWPARVMLSPDDCGHTGPSIANAMTRKAAASKSRPRFDTVAISVLLQSTILIQSTILNKTTQQLTSSESEVTFLLNLVDKPGRVVPAGK